MICQRMNNNLNLIKEIKWASRDTRLFFAQERLDRRRIPEDRRQTQSADTIVRIDLLTGNSPEDPRIHQSKYQNSPGLPEHLPDIIAQLPGIPEQMPDKPELLEALANCTSQSAQHPNAD